MRAAWIVVLAACGEVSASKVDSGTGDVMVDVDPAAPPTVVSTMPANNAAGVRADATIVVQFSKAMDQTSVQSAWTSADLPTANVMFSWNANGDTLTVTPNQPLPVAMGTGLNPSTVTATRIMYSIAATAKDTMGQPLASALAVQFTTIRLMTHDVGIIDALTQSVVNDGTVISPPSGGVGDSNFANTFFRVFVSFSLPALPAGATLERAELSGGQTTMSGLPYSVLGGNLKAQHVNFAAFDINTFSATPLGVSPIGDFSTNGVVETKRLAVTPRVMDDYANAAARGNRSQYRLEFPTGTNGDGTRDIAFFTRTSFILKLTYTVP